MKSNLYQFIEESEKKFDEKWIDNLQYSGYEMRVMMKNLSTSQQLALVEKIYKDEIEGLEKDLKINWAKTYKNALQDQISHYQELLKDLSTNKVTKE